LAPALFIQSSREVERPEAKVIEIEAPINPHLQEFLSEYDSLIQTIVHKTPGAAIVIVKGDSIIFSKGYGIKSINDGDSVDINTVFRIGSVSKGFASVLTGTLAQKNLLSYDDKVVEHYPTFKLKTAEHTQTLNIKHILSQSTGLPYQAYTTMIEDGASLDAMIKELGTLDLIGDPGQYYSYQNVGYSLIEKVLEERTNSTYEELLQRELFTPLNMSSASSDFLGITTAENHALPHTSGKSGWFERRISTNYYNTKAAGGVNASVTDMGQWLKALLGHRQDVLQQSTLDSLFTPQIRTYVRNKYFSRWPKAKKVYYGMGWRIVENGGEKVVCHGGYVNGFSSKIAMIPSEDIGICVLTNSSNRFIGHSVPEFLKAYDQYRDAINDWESQQEVTVVPAQAGILMGL
jgi:beta-lactamase class C